MIRDYDYEICDNAEWLGASELAQGTPFDEYELATIYFNAAVKVLEAAGIESSRIGSAQGQRSLCHGWNGFSLFHEKVRGIGSWAEDADTNIMEAADAAGREAMQAAAADWANSDSRPERI